MGDRTMRNGTTAADAVAPSGMLWRDPLATPGDRFPLGPPPEFWSESEDLPSVDGARPFSLRGVVAAQPSEVDPAVRFVYDSDRQITLVHDQYGAVVPLSKHTKPGKTPSAGTSESRDGDGTSPPPAEEMHPADYQTD